MSWSRAVWKEEAQQKEMTIPMVWIQDGYVRCPEGLQVLKAFKQQLTLKDNWHKFKLIKVKLCACTGSILITVLNSEAIRGVAFINRAIKGDLKITLKVNSQV